MPTIDELLDDLSREALAAAVAPTTEDSLSLDADEYGEEDMPGGCVYCWAPASSRTSRATATAPAAAEPGPRSSERVALADSLARPPPPRAETHPTPDLPAATAAIAERGPPCAH